MAMTTSFPLRPLVTVPNGAGRIGISVSGRQGRRLAGVTIATLVSVLQLGAADIANWIKGSTPGNYNEPANWDLGVVPVNTATRTFVVEVPANARINYDVPGTAEVDAIRLRDNATLSLDGARTFVVKGISILNGPVTATGAGAVFRSDQAAAALGGLVRFAVTNGAQIAVAGTSLEMSPDYRAHRQLLVADGAGAVLDLRTLISLTTHGGWSGAWDYEVIARGGGRVNLSGLTSATGPRTDDFSNDDWLSFRVQSGGTLDLSSLRKISRRVRLVPEQNWTLPALEEIETGWLQPAAGVTLSLPELLRVSGGAIQVPNTAVIQAPKLTSIRDTTVDVAAGGALQAPQVTDLSGSALTLDPGETLQLGSVSQVDRLSLVARATPTFTFSATAYTLPEDWRDHRKLFEADGAGVTLNLGSLQTLTVGGGWNGAWDYSIRALNGATLNLSGLTRITGPRSDAFNNDDWLSFYVQSGGQLNLSSLRTVSRKVRFLPDPGRSISLPALEEAGGTFFNVPSGSVLNLPALRRATDVRFDVDFAGEVNAPSLTNLQSVALNLQAGSRFAAPALANVTGSTLPLGGGENFTAGALSVIDAASFVLRGAAPLTFTATRYELPPDWRAHRALFHATAPAAVLNAGSLQTLITHGGWGGAWDYSVLVENGGVIDLSGLTSVTGPRNNDFDSDDWLTFYLKRDGQLSLNSLATVERRTRFITEESWTLPNLETVQEGYFYPGAGTTLNLPKLREMNAGRLEVPAGALLGAPLATALRNSTLAVAPGGRLNAPQVSDLSGSAVTLEPGEELILGTIRQVDLLSLVAQATPAFTFSVTNYAMPEDYRASRTLFTADGAGVVLDLRSLQSVVIPGGHWGAWNYPFTARNGAFLNLSGLRTATGGRTDTYGADDWLTFRAELGGRMELGDVTLSRLARIQVPDSSGRLKAAGLDVRAPARVEVTDFGTLELTRAFTFNHTDESQLALHSAVVLFTGPGEQVLEVGGQDAGPTGYTTGNFGLGRLEVGQPGQPAVLRLVDAVDNGNRGAGGAPEALYLFGVGTDGLVLHGGSKLVLGSVNVYAFRSGAMLHLNPLLAAADAVNFSGGILARYGGPAITAMSPNAPTLPVVDHVDVTFNTPINAATFTAADVQLTGPAGAIPVSAIQALSGREYRIRFPGQSSHGVIRVRLGPNIADATGLLPAMDQNGNGVAGEAGDAFEGTFLLDTRGPAVVSAMVLRDGGLVGVLFDEEVTPATLADPASYALGGVQPNPVAPRPGNRSAALYFPPVTGERFTLQTVGLSDLLGNTLTTPQSFEGTVLPLSSLTVGTPTGTREAYTHDGVTFELKAGGGSIWNNADHFQFYQEPRTGDFDVRLRVVSLNSPQHWAHVVLMAREHAGANSRHLRVSVYQPNRANVIAFHRRLTQGGYSDEWAGSVSGVPLPNAWVRLQRSGQTFRAYTGTDGSNWTQRAQTTFEMPDTILVGFAASSEDSNLANAATATLADWGDYTPSFVRHPQSQRVFRNQTARLVAEARGAGTLSYQWYFNNAVLAGATQPVLELAAIQPAQAGNYHVVAQNTLGAVTSRVAAVTVDTSDPGAGFEADLMPRPAGDGSLTVADWTMVGRMAVGLDTPGNASEFARADCAPRDTLGNGAISIADWVQAGRYAAGLDPKTPAGGPNGISLAGTFPPAPVPTAARMLSLSRLPAAPERVRVVVRLLALGDENSLGFSLGFDPAELTWEGAAVGRDAATGLLMQNTHAAPEGRVGLALALPAGARFRAGAAEVVVCEFRARTTGAVTLRLEGAPVALEAASERAEPLMLQAAAPAFLLTEPGAGVLSLRAAGAEPGQLLLELQGEAGRRVVLEASPDLQFWEPAAPEQTVGPDGRLRFLLEPAGTQRFFRGRLAE
jgi:regulation of enolase protein 1 (concanavalin A-like superfamily)